MSLLTTAAFAPGATANWDLRTFLTNSQAYVEVAGGALLMLLGAVGVVWGGVLLIKKLMAGQQDQTSWGKIILLVLIGGALLVGGWGLMETISSGGQTTIMDIGNG